MPPRELAYEALSAIMGCEIRPMSEFKKKNPGKSLPDAISPQEFLSETLIQLLKDELLRQISCGLRANSLRETEMRLQTEAEKIRKELFVNDEDFFDPRYDFDFTNITDGGRQFTRGNETYKRPCGWKRFALKVRDKYPDGNRWLETGADAWPVSYQGTSIEGAKGIIQSHYKAGPGALFGKGIYSTPDLDMAFQFTKKFTSTSTGKTYDVILQNRINPAKRTCFNYYWLVPVPEGTSAEEEKKIVEGAIRPYGLLLRETTA